MLTQDEEKALAVEMSRIGYRQTRRQKIIEDNRPNPFKYNNWANNFAPNLGPGTPVMLLFDRHSTHPNLEISKFFKENSYCLPSHSSHITQLLDVGSLSQLIGQMHHSLHIKL